MRQACHVQGPCQSQDVNVCTTHGYEHNSMRIGKVIYGKVNKTCSSGPPTLASLNLTFSENVSCDWNGSYSALPSQSYSEKKDLNGSRGLRSLLDRVHDLGPFPERSSAAIQQPSQPAPPNQFQLERSEQFSQHISPKSNST